MINLSNWSINMLKSDNHQRYKWYVLGEWDSEWQPFFALWSARHWCMESRAKAGDYCLETHAKRMHEEFVANIALDDYEKYLSQLSYLVENSRIAVQKRPEKAEETILVDINDLYRLKCKIDAIRDDSLVDYKSVTTFTKEEEQHDKYWQQAMLYMYWYYKHTGEKKKIVFLEVLKKKQTLPTKKDDLLAMLDKQDKEKAVKESWKVQDIKNTLYIKATPNDVSQSVVFEWQDSIIEKSEDILRRAIIKAEWLRSLQLDDVL